MPRVTFEIARRRLILAAAVLALPACGDDGSLPPPEVRGTIEVVNESADLQLWKLFFRRCGTTNWDLDRLPNTPCTADGCIAPQESRQFIVEAGCYDLRADFADLDAREEVGRDSTLNFVVLVGQIATWNADFDPGPTGPE